MKRNYSLFIKDIVDCIKKIERFMGSIKFEEFVKDDKTSDAVVRELEVIGEAVKSIPAKIRENHPEIPWSDMARMRDKIIHFYFGIDYEIVWKVIKERLPKIKQDIKKVLKEIEEI